MSHDPVATWRSKVIGSMVILLGVAVGARATWELLRPLVPILTVILFLVFIYWLVIVRRR